MLLSIVIVNYNTFEITKSCIESILKYKYPFDYEIIVVDNASKDCLARSLEKCNPNINVIENSYNKGFGNACNQGMNLANGKYFLLLNSDCLLYEDSISKPLKFLESQDYYKILGCKIVDEFGNFQASALSEIPKQNVFWFIFSQLSYSNALIVQVKMLANPGYGKFNDTIPPSDITEVSGITGCYVLLSSQVFTQTRGFDPDFFLYCEETEWFRNRIPGLFRTCYFPQVKVVHLGGMSSLGKSSFNEQNYLSQFLYWYKVDYQKYWAFVLVNFVNFCTALSLLPFMGKNSRISTKAFLKCFFKIIPYIFLEIPRYSTLYGSRPKPLKFSGVFEQKRK